MSCAKRNQNLEYIFLKFFWSQLILVCFSGYPGDIRTGQPTPSPSLKHSTPLPSPATSQPSPATPNDEHHVTSTRSPPTQEGGEPRFQEQNVETRFTSAPVYSLLPPSAILPDPYGQKFGLLSSQDSFYPLGFQ